MVCIHISYFQFENLYLAHEDEDSVFGCVPVVFPPTLSESCISSQQVNENSPPVTICKHIHES